MKEGYNVDVLVFDGCMIRKEEGKYITDDLLNGLSVYVLEKTGYDIKFVEKKLDSSIDLNCYENTKMILIMILLIIKIKKSLKKRTLK